MPHERWHRIREIFVACLDLSESERTAYLDRVCREDPTLRDEVERLLRSNHASEDFLEPSESEKMRSPLLGREGASLVGYRLKEYTLKRVIGTGGMGTVYEAIQENLHRHVALKMLQFRLSSPSAFDRFESESEILASLKHPGIAQIYDAGIHRFDEGPLDVEIPFFVMEFVEEAQTLINFAESKHLDEQKRLGLFIAVCDAVHYGHQKGVIHRDLKPGNILVDGSGKPKIIDYGIASILPGEADARIQWKSGEGFAGTPLYAGPERLAGEEAGPDVRNDVWSLGVVLYELLCHRRPYELTGLSTVEAIEKVLGELPIPPRKANPALPDELEEVLNMALARCPEDRYESVSKLAEDCRRFQRKEPLYASDYRGWTYRTRKAFQRHRVVSVSAFIVVLALLSATVISLISYSNAVEARDLARHQKEEVLRLSDARTLRELKQEAETELWPADARMTERMEDWIKRVEIVLKRRGSHQDALAELKKRAMPGEKVMAIPSRDSQRNFENLSTLRLIKSLKEEALARTERRGESWEKGERELREDLKDVEKLISEITEHLEKTGPPEFAILSDQWQLEVLDQLVSELKALTSTDPNISMLKDVKDRLEFAKNVEWDTILSPMASKAWKHAITEIKNSRIYKGLELKPQLGLMPLGENSSGLWEFWHKHSGKKPVRNEDKPSRWTIGEETGIVFILLPEGEFQMGAKKPVGRELNGENVDPAASADESPVREVTLEPFFLSKYEMTQGQWLRCVRRWYLDSRMQKNKSFYKPGCRVHGTWTLTHPVEQIHQPEAWEAMLRMGLTLPTEAQWEYAARAGTGTVWWTGNEKSTLEGMENLADLSFRNTVPYSGIRFEGWNDQFPFHAPVGSFPHNPWGFHDMLGNISEWCLDGRASYSEPTRPGDGFRLHVLSRSQVKRGGSYRTEAERARSACRPHRGVISSNIGFRTARRVNRD